MDASASLRSSSAARLLYEARFMRSPCALFELYEAIFDPPDRPKPCAPHAQVFETSPTVLELNSCLGILT